MTRTYVVSKAPYFFRKRKTSRTADETFLLPNGRKLRVMLRKKREDSQPSHRTRDFVFLTLYPRSHDKTGGAAVAVC